ncbi:uncharacterized protein LOC124641502 isoform X3 [Helicoverpa zea]|uniref:uncharacterized protein LOC124641502 isoform X3 n=1 Tax=Helicoverpa zea TaxID=7113 RepID=UPI001F5ACA81|nr:uncharacterized protein LOC124641502 isoform X3 [Helicoverpa zea]
MEKNIKIELMKSVDSIKNKIKQMKNQEHSINLTLDKMLKPVTDPLKTLVDSNKTIEKIQNLENTHSNSEDVELSDINTSSSTKFEECYTPELNSVQFVKKSPQTESLEDLEISLEGHDIHDIYEGVNIPFGIRSENKKLLMGNSIVSFSKIDSVNDDNVILIKVGDKTYSLTAGLKELLLRRKPDLKLISSKDKLVYKDMLHYTNAHKRDFNPNGQIRGDKGIKYRDIIKPLFSESLNNNIVTKFGGSLPTLKKYRNNTDLVYWDDPNELVDRLKLLIASRDAGNTNHDNEILSIIEELKEADIIKE